MTSGFTNNRTNYKSAEGTDEYRPSYFEQKRLAEFEVQQTEEETQIIDHSQDKWEPTEKQEQFLEHLLDDKDCKLSLYHAIKAVDGTMRELNRWCRQQPQFLALFRERVQERLNLAELGGDLTVIGAAEGTLQPTRNEKWGIQALLKVREFLHKKEIRLIQINQQFNFGVNMDMSDEQLQRIIGENSPQNSGGSEILEGG